MVELSQTPDPYEKCSFYFIQSLVCSLLCSLLYIISFILKRWMTQLAVENNDVCMLGYLSIFKNIFKQNGERPNDSISPKDLKSKISDDLAPK